MRQRCDLEPDWGSTHGPVLFIAVGKPGTREWRVCEMCALAPLFTWSSVRAMDEAA